MKKIAYTLIMSLIILLFIFFFVVGKVVDGQMNVGLYLDDEDYNISESAKILHDSLIIADWHADNLLWDRGLLSRANHGHVDVPRLIEGNVTLQVFDAVIKTPRGINYDRNTDETDNVTLLAIANRWPIKAWFSLCERALYQSKKIKRAAKNSKGKLKIITSRSELGQLLGQRQENNQMVGGLLSIEGLHALENDISNIDRLYDAGYRMLGLVHFFDNEVGGSSAGVLQNGLTEFGREVIKEMNEKYIIIDLAHASSNLIDDVLALSTRPVVVSHTGVKGTFESPRNLSDEHIIAIAKAGGMIGIGFWDGAVGTTNPSDIVKAMKYVKDLVGVDNLCLGSDWDGATTTHFDAAHISVLTDEMMKSGFSNEEIKKIMGANQIRFLLQQLP